MTGHYPALPVVPRPLARVALAALAWGGWKRLMGHVYTVLLTLLRNSARPWPIRGHLTARIFDEFAIARLRQGEAPPQAKPLDEILAVLAAPLADLTPDRLAYLGKSMFGPNRAKILSSMDMTGVCVISPYLHDGLSRLARRLPDALCRPRDGGPARVTGKAILMRMAEVKGLLPHAVIYQPKKAAVDGPLDQWYAGPLRPAVKETLARLPFACSPAYVEQMLRPKRVERLYQKLISLDELSASHKVSLLWTYAALTAMLSDPCA